MRGFLQKYYYLCIDRININRYGSYTIVIHASLFYSKNILTLLFDTKRLQHDTNSNLPTTTIEKKDTFYSEKIEGLSLTKDTLVCSDEEKEMGVVRVFDRTRKIPRQKYLG